MALVALLSRRDRRVNENRSFDPIKGSRDRRPSAESRVSSAKTEALTLLRARSDLVRECMREVRGDERLDRLLGETLDRLAA